MPTSLLAAVRDHAAVAEFLSWPGDFDLLGADHGEPVQLASGLALEAFAGDGAGGTFFFCGDGGEERPVLYADSEGSAALLALGLPDLLRLLLTAPWWRDCPGFTAEESDARAAEYLADDPDLYTTRDAVAALLGLTLPTPAEALARLRQTATGPGRDYVLIFTPEGTPYEALIS
ncbi:hypothetical protein ACFV1L_11400 [Kitasatospora sp. NPDC059646]|uniref:hypothetical protein n=1 Tax=Kitasatospora sp. NPDC059646 TaxID=3346893 RepID=UPI0036A627F2